MLGNRSNKDSSGEREKDRYVMSVSFASSEYVVADQLLRSDKRSQV